jgi:glycosyltransferase involved in cell wall biosynthesis
MDISVIVTNFNYDRYLARCLRSLVAQSLSSSNYEIVLVDDASTDNSLEVASTFKEQIKIFRLTHNQGLASAANEGFRNSQGRLIVRVDADDYVHPEFLKVLVTSNELLGDQYDAFSLDYENVDEDGNVLNIRSSNEFPIGCAIAFKNEALQALGAYKDGLRIFEEKELMKRFIASEMKLHNISLPLYRYVQHSSSLTRRTFK